MLNTLICIVLFNTGSRIGRNLARAEMPRSGLIKEKKHQDKLAADLAQHAVGKNDLPKACQMPSRPR